MTSRISIIINCILIALSVPFYATIAGFSLMAFDSGDSTLRPWLIAGSLTGICILIPLLSCIFSIRNSLQKNFMSSLLITSIPWVCMGIFWLWLSQQSFS